MTSQLFTPLQIGNSKLSNRITVAPMCQYSAVDGSMSDWHLMHLGSLAISGASMLVMEATGVTPAGRITPYCPGLYSDANVAPGAEFVFHHKGLPKAGLQAATQLARRYIDQATCWPGHHNTNRFIGVALRVGLKQACHKQVGG